MRKNIAVLASGSGTNAENIIRYFREKSSACVALVLTNRQNAFVLERSRGLEVPCSIFRRVTGRMERRFYRCCGSMILIL